MLLQAYKPNHIYQGNRRCYRTYHGDFPGVTTILGATKKLEDRFPLERWRANTPENERQSILDRGNYVHQRIEHQLDPSKPLPEFNSTYDPWWQSIAPFLERIQKTILVESTIWHRGLKFAGTLDCLATIDDKLTLLDWKTASKKKIDKHLEDYKLQAGAYSLGLEEIYGEFVDQAYVVIALYNEIQLIHLDRFDLEDQQLGFKVRCLQYHRQFRN